MDKSILDRLNKSLEETKIAEIVPDDTILDTALKLQGHNLASLSESQLSSYIYTLTQYMTFLHVQHNTRNIVHLEAEREYDLKLATVIANINGKTVKEREVLALQSSEELQIVEKKAREKKADFLLFDNVPESIGKIADALKKELTNRLASKYGKKYE